MKVKKKRFSRKTCRLWFEVWCIAKCYFVAIGFRENSLTRGETVCLCPWYYLISGNSAWYYLFSSDVEVSSIKIMIVTYFAQPCVTIHLIIFIILIYLLVAQLSAGIHPIECVISELICMQTVTLLLLEISTSWIMNTDFMVNKYSMWQLADRPTHAWYECLGWIFFISRPDFYRYTAYRSLIKTKHVAVLVQPYSEIESEVIRYRLQVRLYTICADIISIAWYMHLVLITGWKQLCKRTLMMCTTSF